MRWQAVKRTGMVRELGIRRMGWWLIWMGCCVLAATDDDWLAFLILVMFGCYLINRQIKLALKEMTIESLRTDIERLRRQLAMESSGRPYRVSLSVEHAASVLRSRAKLTEAEPKSDTLLGLNPESFTLPGPDPDSPGLTFNRDEHVPGLYRADVPEDYFQSPDKPAPATDRPKYIEWTEAVIHGVRVFVNDTVLGSMRKKE